MIISLNRGAAVELLHGLYGLGAMTVEEYAASVVGALQALGFTTRTQTNVEPDRLNTPNVRIWMRMGAGPELSTDLTQNGQPWVIYSASNIASIQAGRYQDMYGEHVPEQPSTPVPVRRTIQPSSREETQLPLRVVATPPAPAVVPPAHQSVPEILATQAGAAGVPSGWVEWATANPWLLAAGAAAVLFFVMRSGK